MSSNGRFEEEDSDIVKLLPETGRQECTGWINIGLHSVKLQLTTNGSLIIQSFARSNEHKVLTETIVKKEIAVAAGGVDDDDAVNRMENTDFGLTVQELENKHGIEHPTFAREDWRNEVAQGDTKLGYWEWVLHQAESHYHDACDAQCGATACDKIFVSDIGYVCHECAKNAG